MDKTIVGKFIDTYCGGEPFFNALDDHIKHSEEVLDDVFELMTNAVDGYSTCIVIMSGEIGLVAFNYGYAVDLIVNGGLREGKPITDLSKHLSEGRRVVIIDDSYYSGKTVNAITAEVERCGSKVVAVVVAYDGSPNKVENLHSLYAYYEK